MREMNSLHPGRTDIIAYSLYYAIPYYAIIYILELIYMNIVLLYHRIIIGREYMSKRSCVIIIFALVIGMCGCKAGTDSAPASISDPEPGDRAEFSASGVSFGMRYVPGDIVFPMDYTDAMSTANTMEKPYWIAETEVTYELWKEVYDWAVSGKGKSGEGAGAYTFIHSGRQGGDNSSDGGPVGTKYHPVTNVSWRDAMIWCNALTEWYNAQTESDLKCVYCTDESFTDPIRAVDTADDYPCILTPGTQDNPFVDPDADGFRLPTGEEWTLAKMTGLADYL
jgi:hypothetical protein